MANKYETKKMLDKKRNEEEKIVGDLLANPIISAKVLDKLLQKITEYIIQYKQSEDYLMNDLNMLN